MLINLPTHILDQSHAKLAFFSLQEDFVSAKAFKNELKPFKESGITLSMNYAVIAIHFTNNVDES